MPSSQRRTQAEQDLIDAARKYVVAKETPGVPIERHYHAMRHAAQRVASEDVAV